MSELSENELNRKFMMSTSRAMLFVHPENDRDAELMGVAYIGAMNDMGTSIDDIKTIIAGVQFGWKDLLKLATEE